VRKRRHMGGTSALCTTLSKCKCSNASCVYRGCTLHEDSETDSVKVWMASIGCAGPMRTHPVPLNDALRWPTHPPSPSHKQILSRYGWHPLAALASAPTEPLSQTNALTATWTLLGHLRRQLKFKSSPATRSPPRTPLPPVAPAHGPAKTPQTRAAPPLQCPQAQS